MKDEYTKPFDLKIWKRLLPTFKPYRWGFAGILFGNIMVALLDTLTPLFQQYAISEFIEQNTVEGLLPYGIAFFAVLVLSAAMGIFFCRCSIYVEMSTSKDLRHKLFRRLQTLSLSYYNTTPVGHMISRVMSDVEQISAEAAWGLADIIWSLFYVCCAFGFMLILNWKLALLVMLIVPIIAVLTLYFQGKILHWNRKVRKQNSKITSAFHEGISGAKTSKTLATEERCTGAFRDTTGEMQTMSIHAAHFSAIYVSLVMFFSTIAVALVLLRGGHLYLENALEIATLSTFLTYAVGIFDPVQNIAQSIANVTSLQASVERVTDLAAETPLIQDREDVIAKYGDVFDPKRENWEPLVGDIEFQDVTFRYPDGGENVLEHFSLKIPAGTTVAIVGETGAGKSTLVNLVCRFFEPTSGKILIDGRDYRDRSQLWLHSNIGYVLQNPHLFSGSIRENIRYGKLNATDAEVEAAAKAVSADLVVQKLEEGWDSDVGEGGDRLSTGEKQLISFARAVLANPRIFVLDEATSSIDTQTEQIIQNAIDHLLENRTSFLIAHRLSTIRKADLILVVRDGKIVEQGQHEELLKKGSYYRSLYAKQFAKEQLEQVLR